MKIMGRWTARSGLSWSMLVGILFAWGCSSSPPPTTIHEALVRGVVTLNGRPLSRGTVTFLPQSTSRERIDPGIARIEPDGSFWVGNANLSKPAGVKPGRYRATVLAMDRRTDGSPGPPAQLMIPEKYTDEASTPFEFEIVEGQNRFRLDMTTDQP
jgi:hypothetical protein